MPLRSHHSNSREIQPPAHRAVTPPSLTQLPLTRRRAIGTLAALLGGAGSLTLQPRQALAAKYPRRWEESIQKGLKWVKQTQSKLGHWTAGGFPTAMTALAGTALIASGSTATQGPYANTIKKAVDYIVARVRANGLIGDMSDSRYTYGHGFSMLFLSQVLGEEEDVDRRKELIDVLNKAVKFTCDAQTKSGGWGYVSAKDGNDFDEGSTTITQVQGLRGCRNAGIPVPKTVIDSAIKYIIDCKNADGGISYSSKNRGSSRPAITAAALAALYNAGEDKGKDVAEMLKYCKENLYGNLNSPGSFGHWHYTYMYYAQVVYRQGVRATQEWIDFRDKIYNRIVNEQSTTDGSWEGTVGPIYVTASNLIILQLEKAFLPIYQR